jgi:gliding motility-associated lipoprotein GldH
MENKFKLAILLALFSIILISCDSNRVFQEYKKIDKYVWDSKDIVEFEFEIEDTLSVHNMYIFIRHSGNYPFNNLWLFVTSTAPNGTTAVDTVQMIFADKTGKWLGDGSGDLWDNKYLWKQFVKFPMQGKYKVQYQHGMRLDHLPGILDAGFRIETTEFN